MLISKPSFTFQSFSPDLTVSSKQNAAEIRSRHVISSFDDLSVTLLLPPDLVLFLVRGSPFLTLRTNGNAQLLISTVHSFLSIFPNPSCTKHRIVLSNNQTWLCFSSSPLNMTKKNPSVFASTEFSGVVRLAVLAGPDLIYETLLDRFSSCYPISGTASFVGPFCLNYQWEKKGWEDLLLLAHPLHLQLLSMSDHEITVLDQFGYNSIDGALVGVVGNKWVLRTVPISLTWYSIKGINEEFYSQIGEALAKDVEALNSIPLTTASLYF